MDPLYETFWRHTADGLFVVRVEPCGGFVFEGLNPALERASGLRCEDLRGRTPEQALTAAAAAAVTGAYRRCVAAGGPVSYEEELELAGRTARWRTNLVPLKDAAGRVVLLLGSARDLTHELRTRAALEESEARYRLIAETAPSFNFVAARGLEYVSPNFFRYYGAAPGAPPAWRRLLHPDDLAAVQDARREAAVTGRFDCAVRLKRHDGAWRWHQVRARPIDPRNAGRWVGVASDIHELRTIAEDRARLNERLQSILGGISDGYFTLDHDWRVTGMNRRSEEWFGVSAARLVGRDLREALPPMWDEFRTALLGATTAGRSVHQEFRSGVHAGRWLEVHVYPSIEGASVFFRDVTLRRAAQEESEAARRLLQSTLDSLSAHVALLDESGTVVAVNRAWREFAGANGYTDPKCGVGVNYLDVCRAAAGAEDAARAVLDGLAAVLGGARKGFRYTYPLAGPRPLWFQVRATRFRHERTVRVVVAHEDVTEVVNAQAALTKSADDLVSIQEEERRRIAVELHDSTGQHLVAIGLGLSRLRELAGDVPAARPILSDMALALDQAHREIRIFTYLLHPPELDRDGLAVTLRRFAEGFARRSDLRARVEISGDLGDLPAEVQRALFRVVQEALANVHRHAAARSVEVRLTGGADRLSLTVKDDGRGLPKELAADSAATGLGVGIPGMRARIRQLGGELRLSSAATGTTVRAVVPWPKAGRRPAGSSDAGVS
jgi:PAS domain S-box-containing protein